MIRWLLNHLQIIRKVLEPFLIHLKLIIQDRLIFSLLLLFFDRPTDRGLDKKIEFIQAYWFRVFMVIVTMLEEWSEEMFEKHSRSNDAISHVQVNSLLLFWRGWLKKLIVCKENARGLEDWQRWDNWCNKMINLHLLGRLQSVWVSDTYHEMNCKSQIINWLHSSTGAILSGYKDVI